MTNIYITKNWMSGKTELWHLFAWYKISKDGLLFAIETNKHKDILFWSFDVSNHLTELFKYIDNMKFEKRGV